MIYRVLIDDSYRPRELSGEPSKVVVPGKLVGAAGGDQTAGLSDVMWRLELPSPEITNPRTRFYFTERGWREVGRAVAAEARKRGHVVRVVRRKNPRRSRVVYRDALQVAILPPTPGPE